LQNSKISCTFAATCLPRFPLEQRAQGGQFINLFMDKILYAKPFLSYQKQILLLKSRGLTFTDEAKALHLLQRIGYYRFNVYWRPLLADKKRMVFKPNASFESAFALIMPDCGTNPCRFSRFFRVIRNRCGWKTSMGFPDGWREEALWHSSDISEVFSAKI
jgi:hypothetical protein